MVACAAANASIRPRLPCVTFWAGSLRVGGPRRRSSSRWPPCAPALRGTSRAGLRVPTLGENLASWHQRRVLKHGGAVDGGAAPEKPGVRRRRMSWTTTGASLRLSAATARPAASPVRAAQDWTRSPFRVAVALQSRCSSNLLARQRTTTSWIFGDTNARDAPGARRAQRHVVGTRSRCAVHVRTAAREWAVCASARTRFHSRAGLAGRASPGQSSDSLPLLSTFHFRMCLQSGDSENRRSSAGFRGRLITWKARSPVSRVWPRIPGPSGRCCRWRPGCRPG